MNIEKKTTSTSVWGAFSLAVLGTTCCALPIVLVALGMGSVVASVVSALPALAWLSQYKAITFSVTALVLAYSGWRLRGLSQKIPDSTETMCSIEDGKHLKWQKQLLGLSTVIFILAVFAAYALLPIMRWWDSL